MNASLFSYIPLFEKKKLLSFVTKYNLEPLCKIADCKHNGNKFSSY